MLKNLCIIAILLLAGCAQKSEKKVLLRLHLQPNEKFDVEIENHTEMALGSAYTRNNLRFLFQVDSVLGKDTGYVLACKLERVQIQNAIQSSRITYDSHSKKANDSRSETDYVIQNLKKMMKDVVDSTVWLHVNNRGEVKEHSILKNDVVLSAGSIPASFNLFQMVFPKEPVAMLDEWTNEEQIANAWFKRMTNYRLIEIKDSIFRIAAVGKLWGFAGMSAPTPFKGEYGISQQSGKLLWATMQMKINLSWEGEGTYTVSITSH